MRAYQEQNTRNEPNIDRFSDDNLAATICCSPQLGILNLSDCKCISLTGVDFATLDNLVSSSMRSWKVVTSCRITLPYHGCPESWPEYQTWQAGVKSL